MNILKTTLALTLLTAFSLGAGAQTTPAGQVKTTKPANAPANGGQRPQAAQPAATQAERSGSNNASSNSEVEEVFWGPMPAGSAWNKGVIIGQAGLGLVAYGGGYGVSIPVYVAAEYGVHERFGLGGILGYSAARYNSRVFGGTYAYRRSVVTIGARGTYHLAIEDLKELDLYGGAMLGVRLIGESYPVYDAGRAETTRTTDRFVRPGFGIFLGGRYFFTPTLGAFAELGASVAWLSGGIALKIR